MSLKDIVVVLWNCRGINKRLSRNSIKAIRNKTKASMLCIQETKCQDWNLKIGNQIWGNTNHGWVVQKSDGQAGGLACAWDSDLLNCVGMAQSKYWIWLQMQFMNSKERFNIINIYSSVHSASKRQLWMDLSQICSLSEKEPVCLLGDFNSVRNENERKNCAYRKRDSVGFDNFIKGNNLMDIGIVNSLFTWFGRDGKCSKLDRVLINDNWYSSGSWKVETLSRQLSDHKALCLQIDSNYWGPRPFKAFNWWLSEEKVLFALDQFWKDNMDSKEDVQVTLKKLKGLLKE